MSSEQRYPVIPVADVDRLREGREIIRAEAAALLELTRMLDISFCAAVDLLQGCTGAVVVTGMGKAGLVGRKITATLSSTGTRALFLHPAEAVHGDLGAVRPGDVVLAFSNSGESEELVRLLPLLREAGASIIAVTGRETSTLAAAADVTVCLGNHREAGHFGLAPTTTTTAMLALGDALALVASHARGFTRQHFARVHPAGSLGRRLQSVRDVMRSGSELRIALQSSSIRDVLTAIRKPSRRTGAVMLTDDAGLLRGIFTDSDLVRLLEARREDQLDRPVAEVMTCSPRTITEQAALSDAIEILSKYHISELPVVNAVGEPVGLIDITDVIALLPEQRAE